MTKDDVQTFRKHLLALRSRIKGDVSHLTDEALRDSNQASTMPLHMADLGTDNFEQEFTLSLVANEEQVLTEIADALERMDQGNFGRCEECETSIPKARLKELPYARYCVGCARKLEQRS